MNLQKVKILEQIKTMGFAYEAIFNYLDRIKQKESDYDTDSSSLRESEEMAREREMSDNELDSTHDTPVKTPYKMIQGSRKYKLTSLTLTIEAKLSEKTPD